MISQKENDNEREREEGREEGREGKKRGEVCLAYQNSTAGPGCSLRTSVLRLSNTSYSSAGRQADHACDDVIAAVRQGTFWAGEDGKVGRLHWRGFFRVGVAGEADSQG